MVYEFKMIKEQLRDMGDRGSGRPFNRRKAVYIKINEYKLSKKRG